MADYANQQTKSPQHKRLLVAL